MNEEEFTGIEYQQTEKDMAHYQELYGMISRAEQSIGELFLDDLQSEEDR